MLLVGPRLFAGGAELRFRNLVGKLFGGNGDVALLIDDSAKLSATRNRVVDLKFRGKLSYLKSILILSRQIRHTKYDVVFSFGLFPGIVSFFALLFCKNGPKHIVHEITRPRSASLWNGGVRSVVHLNLRKLLFKGADLLTANSLDGLVEACELAGKSIESGVKLSNLIDDRLLLANSKKHSEIAIPNQKYIIMIGRLVNLKRVDTVLEAMTFLKEEVECNLIIVGSGEALGVLKENARQMKIENRVVFTGHLENPAPLLAEASALILASEYEGFSNSVLEAMFLDVPVVTSYCSSDAVEMCKYGAALGFEVGNSRDLAEIIAKIFSDTEDTKNVVEKAQLYREAHTLANGIGNYETTIHNLCTKS